VEVVSTGRMSCTLLRICSVQLRGHEVASMLVRISALFFAGDYCERGLARWKLGFSCVCGVGVSWFDAGGEQDNKAGRAGSI
jgi:hypothetical protein